MTRADIKMVAVGAACLLFRLLPFRPPNVETILAAQMPIGGILGARRAFLFGFFSILLFDVLTGTVGPWTFVTAPSYGIIGMGSAWYFRKRIRLQALHFGLFSALGTIFYDAVTGLSIGPIVFGQPFAAALAGQVPFTLMHLLGNVSFALLLSPLLLRLFEFQKGEESAAAQPLSAVNLSPVWNWR